MSQPGSDWKERAARVRQSVDMVELVSSEVELRKEGALHKGCCPFHTETSPSFAVYPDGYKCFGCGAHGDQITWVRERLGLTFAAALDHLEGGTVPKLAEPRKAVAGEKHRRYHPILPVPEKAPPIPMESWVSEFRARLKATAIWWYVTAGGTKLMADLRYEGPHPKDPTRTKKAVITWCWSRDDEDGSEHWAQTRPGDHLQLYGLDRLLERPDAPIVVCEGCKKADAIGRFAGDHVGVSWCGGVESVAKTDWSPLKGRKVIIWPDFDKVGACAAADVVEQVRAAGGEVIAIVTLAGRLPELPESFDAADCKDGPELLGLLGRQNPPSAELLASLILNYPGDPPKRSGLDLAEQLRAISTLGDDFAKALTALMPSASRRKRTTSTPSAAPTDPPTNPPAETAEPPADDAADIERGDLANASRFVLQHHKRARYCADFGKEGVWLLWDNTRWAIDTNERIRNLAEATIRSIAKGYLDLAETYRKEAAKLREQANESENEDEQMKLRGKAKGLAGRATSEERKIDALQKLARIEAMLVLARSRREITISAVELDTNPDLLNTPSGTIDLRDGRVYQHDPKHLITRLCGCDYRPDATSKDLTRVVEHVTNYDPDTARYAQHILGVSVFGHNKHEKIYLWQGDGGSGKGTLMEAVKAALGDYAMTAEFQSFIKTQGARVRDDLDRLKYARIVLASESDKGEELSGSVLKQLSGRDTVATRALFGSYQEFRARMTIHLQSNHKPRVDDQDGGMWRRLICIPCGPQVTEDKRDPDLKDRIIDPKRGLPAVLAWLVRGAIATHAMKSIPMSDVVTKATAEYRVSQDPTREFFLDHLRFASVDHLDQTYVAVSDLMRCYHAWAESIYLPKNFRLSDQALAKRFESRGCYRKVIRVGNLLVPAGKDTPPTWGNGTKPARCWVGVTLADGDHAALHPNGKGTFTPTDAESEAVTLLRCNGGVVKSPSCARANTHTEPLLEEVKHSNIVTTENLLPATPEDLSNPDLTAGFDGAQP